MEHIIRSVRNAYNKIVGFRASASEYNIWNELGEYLRCFARIRLCKGDF